MPNVLRNAAGGRTLLWKPRSTLDKPVFGLGGQLQAYRRKPIPQEVEPAANPADERLVGVFCQSQSGQHLIGSPDRGAKFPTGRRKHAPVVHEPRLEHVHPFHLLAQRQQVQGAQQRRERPAQADPPDGGSDAPPSQAGRCG